MSHTSNTLGRSKSKLLDPLLTGNAKLTKFAIRHDSRRMNNDLEGFNGHSLNKEEFDYQLKRCLTIYLTREELDAVFEHIDADQSQFLDGVEFLRYFFRLGQDARHRIQADIVATAAKTQAMKDVSEEEERQRMVEENCSFKIEYNADDTRTGMRKLCQYVARFHCTLDCVEFRDITSFLAPLEFKAILEKLTTSRFTDREIAALLNKYGDAVPPRLVKNGIWSVVDGTHLIKCLVELRKQEVVKDKERTLLNAQSHHKVQLELGGGLDLFPKCLGR